MGLVEEFGCLPFVTCGQWRPRWRRSADDLGGTGGAAPRVVGPYASSLPALRARRRSPLQITGVLRKARQSLRLCASTAFITSLSGLLSGATAGLLLPSLERWHSKIKLNGADATV